VADYPEIKEIDINPLLVSPEEVIALDARITPTAPCCKKKPKRYEHLVLRPYPEEFIRKARMGDGTEITLRPIRPEDEPLWFELLGSCSRETIYSRFRYFFSGSRMRWPPAIVTSITTGKWPSWLNTTTGKTPASGRRTPDG